MSTPPPVAEDSSDVCRISLGVYGGVGEGGAHGLKPRTHADCQRFAIRVLFWTGEGTLCSHALEMYSGLGNTLQLLLVQEQEL